MKTFANNIYLITNSAKFLQNIQLLAEKICAFYCISYILYIEKSERLSDWGFGIERRNNISSLICKEKLHIFEEYGTIERGDCIIYVFIYFYRFVKIDLCL